MFQPLSLYLGLKYTRAKRRNHFISFISLSSIIGIALGVAVLITVLSVMNGFDAEIQNRIFEMAPQVTIRNFSGSFQNWQPLSKQIAKTQNVQVVAPFASGQGMLTFEGTVMPALINGVDPNLEVKVSAIAQKMTMGKMSSLTPGHFNIILGRDLADNLGATIGDKITVVTPQASFSPAGFIPTFKRFTVSGIFSAGNGFGFDSQLAYINLQDAQALLQIGQGVTGLRLKINNLYNAPAIGLNVAKQLTSDFYVTNWTMDYGPLVKAIRLEKTMMFMILLLIVAVAAFNLVASLVMVVNDKQADIAILRTLGATPQMIMKSFIIQGFVIGASGTIIGLIIGIILALNATSIVSGLQNLFHVQFLSSSVYYVDYLPSKLALTDVVHVCLSAFILSLLATLYPAWRAAKTLPAEALRYE